MWKKIKNYLRPLLPEKVILWTHKMRAVLACILYGFPARGLKVIGVTGTNGKTTTCNLIAAIFEEAGYSVGMATTINFKIADKLWPNESKMTTLNPFILQKLFRDMNRAGCQYAVIETTSHAISQYRNWGIKYHSVVFTNITHDHLDYHKNFKEYLKAKLKLFSQNPKVSVINIDDKQFNHFLRLPAQETYLYSLHGQADVAARKTIIESADSLFTLITPKGQIPIHLSLPGEFNIYNALAAVATAIGNDIDLKTIKKALEKVKSIPGRMEKVDCGQKPTVIVDFAHTPDGLQKVFETIIPAAKGKIIHVGGATGDRDRSKRPIMGAIAGRFADIVIVTDEDPASEDPQKIIDSVAGGVARGATKDKPKKLGENFFKILNRKSAIFQALSLAKKDDLVLITGKGCETKMVVGRDQYIPWSDRGIVEEYFGKISNS